MKKGNAASIFMRKLACEEEQEIQWLDNDPNSTRTEKKREERAKKREQRDKKRAEVQVRKAHVLLLEKQEKEDLDRLNRRKKDRESEAQRAQLQWEEELEAIRKQVEEEQRRKLTRIASKKEYEKMILVENKNHDSIVEARNINEALSKLTAGKENLEVVKVRAKVGNKGDCLFVYTRDEEKPLLVDLRITV